MRQIPDALNSKFKTLLINNKIPQRDQYFYLKWLRYYLDFCHKYRLKEYDTQSLPDFINKLKEKKQTAAQQQQAAKAIKIYYGFILSQYGSPQKEPAKKPQEKKLLQESPVSFREPLQAKLQPNYIKPNSALKKAVQKDTRENWNKAFTELSNEITVRHYSPKTLKSYSTWVRKLYYHCNVIDPELLTN